LIVLSKMFRLKLRKILPYVNRHIFINKSDDYGVDELETQVTRCKPEDIESLSKHTKFSRHELQVMYRGFKQECPSGIVNEDTFKDIYARFFPQGDTTTYAHLVFKMFDLRHIGTINFEDFVRSLSLLARGTLEEKLRWTFNLYDVNEDGVITKDEMFTIVTSIYSIMGKYANPSIDNSTINEHVEKVFQAMDTDCDGVISLDEFMESCSKDHSIVEGVMALDTSFCS
jgi:Ca2+-binding EF-hand superfamily protein